MTLDKFEQAAREEFRGITDERVEIQQPIVEKTTSIIERLAATALEAINTVSSWKM